ncbi:MAG: 16S rRNA (guanine(966)-N(2))-methyltransferase RsmD [Chloroflexota bacterium]|nr:16S rRNA (guanine(966)-N(2))-methyltransferase RsmD [Chloroflexota bacterium]
MRVITGSAKGRILKSVPGKGTRPITDRVKVALFDILAPYIVRTRFLDLFAGTGSVGIEALSRGAAHATFVEREWRAIRTIEENLKITDLAERATVIQEDVFRFLERQPNQSFDIIYIAPPQYQGLWARALQILDRTTHLASGGLAIAQIFPKEFKPLELASLGLVDQRSYGSTLLCFYQSVAVREGGDD